MKSICLGCLALFLMLAVGTGNVSHAREFTNQELLEKVNLYFGVELFGTDGERMRVAEKRLRSMMEKMGLMIRDTSPYLMHGRAEIINDQEVSGGATGPQYIVIMELQLFLEDTRDKQVIGSATFSSKGMAKTEAKAIKAAVRNLKFKESDLAGLQERALERVAIMIDEECDRLYGEAKELHDKRAFREALVPLSRIVAGATIYPEAEALTEKINADLWREEENRVKMAQAKAKAEEEKKLQAMYKAEEAQSREREALALEQAARDSLELVKTQKIENEEKREFELERLEKEIILMEREIELAAEEKEIAMTNLASTLESQQEAVSELDAALENVRPVQEDEASSGKPADQPWEAKPVIGGNAVSGKWELVKNESIIDKRSIEAGTLEMDSGGKVTVWIVGEASNIVMSRGQFSIKGDQLTFDFEKKDVSDYLGDSYEFKFRGDSRLYLVDAKGNQFAFCKLTT